MVLILEKMEFRLYHREGGALVKGVAQFKYLGQPLDQTDNDWLVVDPLEHQEGVKSLGMTGKYSVEKAGRIHRCRKISTWKWSKQCCCLSLSLGSC